MVLKEFNSNLDSFNESLSQDYREVISNLKDYNNQISLVSKESEQISSIIREEKISSYLEFATEIQHVANAFRKEYSAEIVASEQIFAAIEIKSNEVLDQLFSLNRLLSEIDDHIQNSKGTEQFNKSDKSIAGARASLLVLINKHICQNDSMAVTLLAFEKAKVNAEQFWSGFQEQIHAIRTYIEEKHESAMESSLELQHKADACFSEIDKLIVDLQYHDIISQKIEHIRELNQNIINDLEQMAAPDGASQVNSPDMLLLRLSSILELHKGFVELTNQEYSSSFSGINDSLEHIYKTSSAVALFRIDYSDYLQMAEVNYLEDVRKTVGKTVSAIEEIVQSSHYLRNESAKILEHYERLNTLAENACDETVRFNELINKASFSELDAFNDNLIRVFDNMLFFTHIIDDIKSKGRYGNGQLLEKIQERAQQSTGLVSLMDVSIAENSDGESSIEYARATARFKNMIERVKGKKDVVSALMEVEGTLQRMSGLDLSESDKEAKEEFLKTFEEIYTMESERKIHKRVLSQEEDSDEEEDSGEVEFF